MNAPARQLSNELGDDELDDIKDNCLSHFTKSKSLYESGHEQLRLALATAYVWWRAAGGTIEKPYPPYVRRSIEGHEDKIEMANVKRHFTPILRLLLNMTSPSDAAKVSQYAACLDWVHRHFKPEEVDKGDAAVVSKFKKAITAYIKKEDGIEGCRQRQVFHENEKPEVQTQKQAEAQQKAIIRDTGRNQYETRQPIGTIQASYVSDHPDGLMLLLGKRTEKDDIDVVDFVHAPHGEIDAFITQGRTRAVETSSFVLNLLAEALTFGAVVKPVKSDVPVHETAKTDDHDDEDEEDEKNQEKMNAPRNVVFKCANHNHEILIGLSRTNACPIVKLTSKQDLSLPQDTDLILSSSDRGYFENNVMPVDRRRTFTATVEDAPATAKSIKCITLKSDLLAKPYRLYLQNYENVSGRTLDLRNLAKLPDWKASAELDHTTICRIWNDFLVPYEKGDISKDAAVRIQFEPDGLTFCVKAEKRTFSAKTGPVGKKGKVNETVKVRGTDLLTFFRSLFVVGEFAPLKFRCDPDTVLEVATETDLASYRIYLPAMADSKEYMRTAFAPFAGSGDTSEEEDDVPNTPTAAPKLVKSDDGVEDEGVELDAS